MSLRGRSCLLPEAILSINSGIASSGRAPFSQQHTAITQENMTNFDERAKDWDSDPKKVERARAVAEAIRNAIPLTPKMSALEYGCGTGLVSFALQADLGQITLADTSQGMLDVLDEKIAAAGVTNMRSTRLDLRLIHCPLSVSI